MWPGAIKLKSVAWGHIFEVGLCEVCGLEASTDNVLAGAINLSVWPGAIYLKCVAWGHLRRPIRRVAVARGHLSMIYYSLSNLNLDGPRPHTLELMA